MKNECKRMCCVCKSMLPKKQLIRIVKNKNDEIFIDFTGKAEGRGAYICKEENCINNMIKSRALNRAFKTNINNELYLEIKEVIFGNKQN